MTDSTQEPRGRLFEILDNNRLVVTETLAENAIDGIITLISNREKLARIDELERLMKLHTRTYSQTITDNKGGVYLSDSHAYISKYETQERIAHLNQPNKEEQ